MDIDLISGEIGIVSQKRSKDTAILRAVRKLEEGEQAVKVSYEKKSGLNSIRNVVYRYSRETGDKVKSTKDPADRVVFVSAYKNKIYYEDK